MGEAKRRKQTGQPWKGALPDALFVRVTEWEQAAIVLCGILHVLQPPADTDSLMRLVSKLTDLLMDPAAWPRPDAPEVLPLWRDPAQGWHYGLAETMEIKRLLADAANIRVAMSDHGEQCVFTYDVLEGVNQNQHLAAGLLPPRWGG